MNIEDIRIIFWLNVGQERLQVKVDGEWQNVRYVDAERRDEDDQVKVQSIKG